MPVIHIDYMMSNCYVWMSQAIWCRIQRVHGRSHSTTIDIFTNFFFLALMAFMSRCAVKQSINQSINESRNLFIQSIYRIV